MWWPCETVSFPCRNTALEHGTCSFGVTLGEVGEDERCVKTIEPEHLTSDTRPGVSLLFPFPHQSKTRQCTKVRYSTRIQTHPHNNTLIHPLL